MKTGAFAEETAHSSSIPFKNVDLEVLRSIAIILVLIVHLPELFLWRSFPIGNYFAPTGAVDLFFVISGYIITTSLLNSIKKKQATTTIIKSFWIKRVFRILPMAYLWTVIPILLAFSFNSSGVFGSTFRLARDGLANVTQTANFHWQVCNDVVELSGTCDIVEPRGQTPLAPYWSLSTEEQFYMLFPLLLLFFDRRRLTIALAFIPIVLLFVDRRRHFFYVLRFDAIAMGVLLAFAQTKDWYQEFYPKFLEKYGLGLLFAVAGALLIGLVGALSNVTFEQSLVDAIAMSMVFVASFNKNLFTRPFVRLRPLFLWLGDRSYALYLIHIPTYLLANELYFRWHGTSYSDAKFFVPLSALAMILLFEEVSTALIERPLRRYGRAWAKQVEAARPTTLKARTPTRRNAAKRP
ncbi:MAG TPA: acyltransferase [Candidatus Saccharimonadales bacterium]|nr:acyltransferase [Candidatus Saccharimonadales bacterium]